MRPRVIGFDLSLSSSGMSDGQTTRVVQTSPDERLEARLDRQVRGAVSFALSPAAGGLDDFPQGCNADLAVIEAGAFSRGSQSQAAEILSALRMMVRHRLWRLGIPYAMVSPSTLKAYAAGHGQATKQQMVAAVDERHRAGLADVKVKDGRYDMADALALAAMGYDRVNWPLPVHFPAPPPHRASLDAVVWPELVIDD